MLRNHPNVVVDLVQWALGLAEVYALAVEIQEQEQVTDVRALYMAAVQLRELQAYAVAWDAGVRP